ncbi:cation transporter [Tannerella sp. oral taxon 808]|nr:cation transporter [Tannerella sp. oral taxon 808]
MTKKSKGFLLYALLIVACFVSMYLIIREGQSRQLVTDAASRADAPRNLAEGFGTFLTLVAEHIRSSFGLLLLQIIVILITCRLVGLLFKRIGQPMVVGEILAGILLGPSVLGRFAPECSHFLFPPESLQNINLLSQFGLIFFMYTIGMELDLDAIRKKLRETVMISYTCMFLTFFCGLAAAYLIYGHYGREVPFVPFALFIAITMSITAFPVLARIIQERRLTRTHLGTVALAAAANGDVAAWCLLAIVVAISQAGTMLGAVYNIVFAVIYLLVMFSLVRPLLRMVGNLYHNPEVIGKPLVMFMFLLLLISAYLTEIAGLHALFGAFVAGLVMPENLRFRKIMTEKVEDVSLIIFLPLFFVSTGLRTEIGLINSAEMWLVCVGLILVSTLGKFGGAILSARLEKESWKNSLQLGALMNTHGLMELIALTIGYEMHILPPPVFVMLILMTLVSTFMTTPLLALINSAFRAGERLRQRRMEAVHPGAFRVLLSFGRAGSGPILLDVAHRMFSRGDVRLDLTALHLTVGSDINPRHTASFEQISFEPVVREAKRLNLHVAMRYEVSDNAGDTIVGIVNDEPFDFLLVGAGVAMSNLPTDIEARRIRKSLFSVFGGDRVQERLSPGSLIHDKTRYFIERSRCSVGVFVNRGFTRADHLLVVINSTDDLILLHYAQVLLRSTQGTAALLHRRPSADPSPTPDAIARELESFITHTENAHLLPEADLTRESFAEADFMLVGYATWNVISDVCREPLRQMPSTLIIHHREKVRLY